MKLRTIVRSNVVDSSAWTTIQHAASRLTYSEEGHKGYKLYTESDDRYYAILINQNGASTMRLLLDHKAHFEFRAIKSIVVFERRNARDEEKEDLGRSFAVILSDPR